MTFPSMLYRAMVAATLEPVTAPRYSSRILDADGKPALLGHFPVVADPDCPLRLPSRVDDNMPASLRAFLESRERAASNHPAAGLHPSLLGPEP